MCVVGGCLHVGVCVAAAAVHVASFFCLAPQLSWSVCFRRIRRFDIFSCSAFSRTFFCISAYPAMSSHIDTLMLLFSSDSWMCALVFVIRCVVYVAQRSQRDDLNPCERIIPVPFFVKFAMWTARQYVIYDFARNDHLLIFFLLDALRTYF